MKSKLFAKIVYFIVTFSIGILLALFLPYMLYADSSDAINVTGDLLDEGNYVQAMQMVGGYFDSEPAVLKSEGSYGLVLFKAATLIPSESSGDTEVGDKLHKAYAGFLFGASGYKITDQNSQAKLIVNDDYDNPITILDLDLSSDGIADTNSTYYQRGFVYLDFGIEDYGTLTSLELIDKDGKSFAEITFAEPLAISDKFFDDVSVLVEKYNVYVVEYARDHSAANEQTLSAMEAELTSLEKDFFAENSAYAKSASSINAALARSQSNKKATIIVVVYFVCVYVLADFVLGYHYIIRFVRWLLTKVFKVKFKSKKPKTANESFGHDYFCKVTIALDVSQEPNFNTGVQIRYNNQTDEAKFELLKENNYTATERVKAGSYVNLWVDVAPGYAVLGLPDTLEAEGFQVGYKVKIIKREEQSV